MSKRKARQNLYGPTALTEKERRIVRMVWQSKTTGEIAAAIGTTPFVAKNYLGRIYDKTGTSNRLELGLWWEAHREKGLRRGRP